MKRACATCAFFENLPHHPARKVLVEAPDGRIVATQPRRVGECRIQTPLRRSTDYFGDPDADRAAWPVVYGEEWCGQFEPASERA